MALASFSIEIKEWQLIAFQAEKMTKEDKIQIIFYFQFISFSYIIIHKNVFEIVFL